MRLKNSFFYTIREDSKDEESRSGNLLVRAGMIKKSSAGFYMTMPMGQRVIRKIEHIVRDEMNKAGAQELTMPTVIPEEVYENSGRREAFGSNMFALRDRNDKRYVLGPTHEELFAMAGMMDGSSYKDFPYNLYQIQNKFRDETRPRYGLIRTREFTMKDAYSYDVDLAGLDISYQKMFDAYCNSFDRMHLNYKIVKADTGAMGGLLSEEFQAITDIGEDIVVLCDNCDLSSNLEITPVVITETPSDEAELAYEMVETPNAKTIEEVAAFFGKPVTSFVKTLIYNVDGELYAFLMKGDRELNETKVLKLLGANEMELATFEEVEQVTHAKVGFAGPIGLDIKVVMDNEVANMKNFITGANKSDYHYKNVNLKDFNVDKQADIVSVHEGDVCPNCGGKLSFARGIEVGNTFKLGTKYAESMNFNYLDKEQKLHPVVMGSYGIGIQRCMAAIVEQNNDENGIVWPMSVAPYHVEIILVNAKDEAQVQLADALYDDLQAQGVEVLYDDRDERVGVKFKDNELIGIPLRITVGKRAGEGIVEFKTRTSEKEEIEANKVVSFVQDKINEAM
ncbi:proline--tRNA ligase [Erysipelotrichaceae bacterium MTC7]|nr:proline--tRNA ligase [Erysipelotrichaceae bacterium MTC7]